jgi:hypothetical protein
VGTGVLKVFKLAEQTLKPMPLNANRRDTLSFTCQAWVPLGDKGAEGGAAAGSEAAKAAAGDRERQLLGTVDGEILLFEVRSLACCRIPGVFDKLQCISYCILLAGCQHVLYSCSAVSTARKCCMAGMSLLCGHREYTCVMHARELG